MQVLSFYDCLWTFYTEIRRVFVDLGEMVELSNVKMSSDVPNQMNLLSERFQNFIVQNDNRPNPPNCEEH